MSPPHRLLLAPALLAVALLMGSAQAASAFAYPVASPAAMRLIQYPQGDVRAGTEVELAWSTTLLEVQEFEILLSVDGGRRFPIRLTPELDPRSGKWIWKVPNLPAEAASIRIRYGTERGEVETPPTPCFRIEGDPGRPVELEQVHEGEWWSGLERESEPARPAGLAGGGPAFVRSRPSRDFVVPRREAILAPAVVASPAHGVETCDSSGPASSHSMRTPRFVPARE